MLEVVGLLDSGISRVVEVAKAACTESMESTALH